MDKKKVLIVDDDKDTLFVFERILSKSNYKIIKAGNGKECFQQAQEHAPDIIVMDIMMPELDGIATVLKLKSSEKTREIPVIICTAVKEGEDEIVAKNLGVADYVKKSPQMTGLVFKIERILSK